MGASTRKRTRTSITLGSCRGSWRKLEQPESRRSIQSRRTILPLTIRWTSRLLKLETRMVPSKSTDPRPCNSHLRSPYRSIRPRLTLLPSSPTSMTPRR
jgi:hypothetical protein